MSRRAKIMMGAVCAATVTAASVVASSPAAAAPTGRAKHVLLISVDGLHQSDLSVYIAQHPNSALAALVSGGTNFTGAQTPIPSDSFPGMVGQLTGGNPGTTGIYYDDTYNRALLAPGTTQCAGAQPGTPVELTEAIDKDPLALDAGQGLSGLPGSILSMTANPRGVIDTTQLPVDPATCKPVASHNYLQVNTVFQVVKSAGLRTAWSDKHPAYDILNGPSASGSAPAIDDLFTPEINSAVPGNTKTTDWTTDNAATQQYDGYKVSAVLNEIDGYDHSRSSKVGTPALLGLNFQSVSTAQKLPSSDGKAGGYLADGVTPGPLLSSALDFVDGRVGALVNELRVRGLTASTTVVLSAKHGQSPTNPAALTRIDDQPIIDGMNATWKAVHPGAPDLVVHSVDDDAMMMWFSDRSEVAAAFAKAYLLLHIGTGTNIGGGPKPYFASGLAEIHAGADASAFFHAPIGDARVPDLYGITQPGTVFTGGTKKIAEHGGASAQDRNVPIVISGPGAQAHSVIPGNVGTVQIAPTVLALLGLDPQQLQAVKIEHTAVLPAIG